MEPQSKRESKRTSYKNEGYSQKAVRAKEALIAGRPKPVLPALGSGGR